jgi:hypothetical protein
VVGKGRSHLGKIHLDLFLGIQIRVCCGIIPKIFLYYEETLHMQIFTGQTTMGQMVAHGLFSSNANCWEKISTIFRRIFEIFTVV